MAYSTQQKSAIQKALEESPYPVTPVELLELTKSRAPGVGIATIYRYLNTLLKEGKVAVVEVPQSSPRYVLSQDLCSAYMLCTSCQKVFPLKDQLHELQSLSQTQFEVSSYQVFFYGTCKEPCNQHGSHRNERPLQASKALAGARI